MSLDLFGDGFLWMRNTYVLPLVDCNIKEKDRISPKNIKDALKSSFKVGHIYTTTDKNIYNLAIYMEIEKFYSKTLIQLVDSLHASNCSNIWNYVSWYYCSFFVAITIMRIAYRGTTYITKDDSIDEINETANYLFYYTENGIELKQDTKKTHESVWIQFSHFVEELLQHSVKNTDEYAILKKIHSFFLIYGNNFPSSIRNILNYTPDSALEEFKKNYGRITPQELNNILTISVKQSDDITKKIEVLSAIFSYFIKFLYHLYEDLANRRHPRKNYIQKYRETYLNDKLYSKEDKKIFREILSLKIN